MRLRATLFPILAALALSHAVFAEETPPAPTGAVAEPAKPAAPALPKGISSSKPGAPTVRLFILSGQSNMVLLDHTQSFLPAVEAAFPEDDVVVVKDAKSGVAIRRWLKSWTPSEPIENKKVKGSGDLYENLKKKVALALEGKPQPASVVFIWMQGESDASANWSADNYDKSLQDFFSLVRSDMKAPNMPIVLGRISDASDPEKLPAWATVKAKQEAVAKADPLIALINTDDLNGEQNRLHYNSDGYYELGKRFAEAAIKFVKEGK